MKLITFILSFALLPSLAPAQGFRLPGMEPRDEIPLLSPAERKTVEEQREEFARAFAPALTEASKSTVRIWFRDARGRDKKAAYGTVIGDGTQILTKWSEVSDAADDFRAATLGNEVRPVEITGVYPDEDIAILTIDGAPLTPVKWVEAPMELGNFLVASQPDGRPAGYGVVSVLERSLRASDQGFLGVLAELRHQGDGVMVKSVTKDSGAEAVGLGAGDIILKVGDRDISGPTELQNALWGAKPGTEVDLLVLKGGRDEKSLRVLLGGRPESQQFAPERLLQMERMGSKRLSRVREGFPRVVETDMVLEPENVGGPVANLKGEVIGVTMSRAGRTRSYVMTSTAVLEMLKRDATSPDLARAKEREARDERMAMRAQAREAAPQRLTPADPNELQNLQRHQGDMARLMDRIRSEIDALDRGE